MEQVKIVINGWPVTVTADSTVLEASVEAARERKDEKLQIPSLYYYKGIVDVDTSGVCIAEIDGTVSNASEIHVKDGMCINTESEQLYAMRQEALKKICHIYDPAGDEKNEFQTLLDAYGLSDGPFLPEEEKKPLDESNDVFVRNPNKCIRCKRCAEICGKVQRIGAISVIGEGLDAEIRPNASAFTDAMKAGAVNCSNCGQCVSVCPTGALAEKDHITPVLKAIQDPEKYVIVQAAPAVRAGLGEAFGLPVGTDVEGRLAAALRRLGFDKVFDTVFSADLTIMEEASELIERISNGGVLPMITSCCPGWVKYCEAQYGDLTKHLSTCKAPHTMFGAIIKSYYAEKTGIAKENMVVVSVMPCTAKKFEITREDECGAGVPDVDYVLTTRELAQMIKRYGIDLAALPQEEFDIPLGIGTGAGVLFGATGGVMEAALRTASEMLTGKEAAQLEFREVRGVEGLKEASYELNGQTVKVAVVSGLGNTRDMLDRIQGFKTDYQFIEIMACPGGCVNGGGQPRVEGAKTLSLNVKSQRAHALYQNDEQKSIRKSHENPVIKELYDTYLGQPGSEIAHKLLHTTYKPR